MYILYIKNIYFYFTLFPLSVESLGNKTVADTYFALPPLGNF